SAASVFISLATPPTHAGLSRPRTGDLRRLLALPGIPQLLLAAALQWVCMSPYNLFFGAHVQHHGGDARTIGFSIGAAIVGEMLVMATAHRWLPRVAPRTVLTVSAAVGIGRWTATALGSPTLIVAAQSLHAFSFAAFYLSMTDAMVRRTPPELRGSAQSLLTAGGSGVGSLLGGLAAGPLYSLDHGRTLFLAAGAFSVLPALAALAIPPLPRE
ncbi:MAG TPA: MFS transporter, partial [bacterium]|nr:MFS transporter [bacterium]